MKSLFPDMSGRQIAIFVIEVSVISAAFVMILVATIPML